MPLLADYAITPDVFDAASYSTAGECEARLDTIRHVMLTAGLVRDLRAGEWRGVFEPGRRPWHRRGLELVKKLAVQGRLVPHPPARSAPPEDDRGWCAEALASHVQRPLTGGVIATEMVKDAYPHEQAVARIDRLSSAPWWIAGSPSVRLARTLAGYATHLDPVLRHSNSLMFIDPHLDPERRGYRDLAGLLRPAGRRTPMPAIEIHRVCYEGSGRERRFPARTDPGYFKRRFHTGLGEPLRDAGLSAEVFIWDDFHDRYLISNLIGVSLPNGFDTSSARGAVTTWTRLGRKDRDDIQREFDRRAERHALQDHFKVPEGLAATVTL